MSTKQFQFPGAAFTATISATGGTPGAVMSVSAVASGTLAPGQNVVGVTPAANTIASQLSGPTGGTGTYQLQSLPQLPFTNNATGASYTSFGASTTAATTQGQSGFLGSMPYDSAVVAVWMGPTGGTTCTATVAVQGSIDGGAHNQTLTTLYLTGANNMQSYPLAAPYNMYDSLAVNVTAMSGTGETVGGAVRFASKAPAGV